MIITRLYGGLGNQMFQYAIGKSLSIKNNIPLGLDIHYLLDRTPRKNFTFRDFDLDLFNIQAEILPKSKIPLRFRYIRKGLFFFLLNKIREKLPHAKGVEKQNFVFDKEVYEHRGSIYLRGYWQNPNYFQDIRNILVKDFSLKNPLPAHIQSLKEEIKSRVSLCVHVRRGDYVGNKVHDILPSDYYEKAMERFRNREIDHIYVFSDDIGWCRENMSFNLPTTFVGEEFAGEGATGHFELMRACKYFIIPNSTFSWWAAYLADNNDKMVVMPDNWLDSQVFDNNWTKI